MMLWVAICIASAIAENVELVSRHACTVQPVLIGQNGTSAVTGCSTE